jgi:hypothetical protein
MPQLGGDGASTLHWRTIHVVEAFIEVMPRSSPSGWKGSDLRSTLAARSAARDTAD